MENMDRYNDKKFWILSYLGDSADEEMFKSVGIGDLNRLKTEFNNPPAKNELYDDDDDDEIKCDAICGEDIMFCLPEGEEFDFIAEIYHKDKYVFIYSKDDDNTYKKISF